MTNIIQSLKSLGKSSGGNASPHGTPTFAVEVEKYDTSDKDPSKHFVVGKRLDNGETVKVFLRPYTQKGQYPRAEIANFASKRHKVATAPGGVIRFDNCWSTKVAGEFTSSWGRSITNGPNAATEVVLGVCTVRPIKDENGNPKNWTLSLLKDKLASAVTSAEEMQEALLRAFETNGENDPFAVVRVKVDAEPEVLAITYFAKRIEGSNGFKKSAPAEESLAVVLADARMSPENGVLSVLGRKGVTVEVIPGESFWVGGDTKTNAVKAIAEGKANRDPARFYAASANTYGYTDSVIKLGVRENGSRLFIEATPTTSSPTLHSMESLPTAVISQGAKPMVEPSSDEMDRDLAAAAGVDAGGSGGSIDEKLERASSPGRRRA